MKSSRQAELERHYAATAARARLADGPDELHVRGTEATLELAELAGLRPGERVLDVGAGAGGPARTLAARYGVHVVGVDLTRGFVEAATGRALAAGLADRVSFVHGDATALPFVAAAFDVTWTQHAAMNVDDKPRLYGELRRVLRDGGRLALYDVLAGDGGPPDYPLPWAGRAELSFLVDEPSLRALLSRARFRLTAWRDVSGEALAWSRQVAAGDAPAFANLARALEQGRLRLVQAVATAA